MKILPMRGVWLLIIFVASAFKLAAQDPSFAQPFSNPVYLNPGYTGSTGGMRVVANYRDQWSRIPGTFNTTSFAIDISEPCMRSGIGIQAMHNVEGEGFLTTSKAGLIYQFGFLANRNKRTYIGMGIGSSFGSMSIDWDKLEFSDQFHPSEGKQYLSGASRPVDLRRNFFDFDFGMILNHKFFYKHSKVENMWTSGLAVKHLWQPGQTITGTYTQELTPRLYSLHGGAYLSVLGNSFFKGGYVFPHANINFQHVIGADPKFSEFIVGVHAFRDPFVLGVAYKNAETPAHVKNTNAIALIGGFQQPFKNSNYSYQITYSYDVNLTGLSFSTYGSHEISMILFFDNQSLICAATGGSKNIKETNCLKIKRSGFLPPF